MLILTLRTLFPPLSRVIRADMGTLSVLYSQPVAALQIMSADGKWQWIRHIPNGIVSFVVAEVADHTDPNMYYRSSTQATLSNSSQAASTKQRSTVSSSLHRHNEVMLDSASSTSHSPIPIRNSFPCAAKRSRPKSQINVLHLLIRRRHRRWTSIGGCARQRTEGA